MEEKVVTIREFTRNIYKFMKEGGEYVVTKNGKRANVVTIKCHDKEEKVNKYGCGCAKEAGKVLCKKHGRV